MNIFEFLEPNADDFIYEESSIGRGFVNFNPSEIQHGSIYILGVQNHFGTEYEFSKSILVEWWRSFKKLYPNNWKRPIWDLGVLIEGEDTSQFLYAFDEIVSSIQKNKGILILVGGTQALSFHIFKGLEKKIKSVCSVDKKLDLENPREEVNAKNWVSHMILKPEHRLLNYYNFGSQIPYNQIENHDILEQLNFQNIGLGKLIENLKKVEPYLRDSHLLSVDMGAMSSACFNSTQNTVNGLNAREICGIMRYAGLSMDLDALHLSLADDNIKPSNAELLAEMVWYFIDAKNNMKKDGEVHRYRVQWEEEELVFLKSNQSERWWMEVQVDGTTQRIPCEEQDYRDCLKGEIPEKWSYFFKRFF